jgi:hypothetical protein
MIQANTRDKEMRPAKLITISFPAELLDETEGVVRQNDRGRSGRIRDAFRRYLSSARHPARLKTTDSEPGNQEFGEVEFDLP